MYEISSAKKSGESAPAQKAQQQLAERAELLSKIAELEAQLDKQAAVIHEQAAVHKQEAVIHEQEAADPMPLSTLVEDVYESVPRHLKEQYNAFLAVAKRYGEAERGEGEFPL